MSCSRYHSGGLDEHRVAFGGAGEEVLREGRPDVGMMRLGSDQVDAPFEALVAQGLGRRGAGQPGADDHEILRAGHDHPSPVRVVRTS